MKSNRTRSEDAIQVIRKKASQLPVGFMIGTVIGCGLFLYANRRRGSRTSNAVISLAQLAAPYVIISVLDKIVDKYEVRTSDV